MTLEQMFEYRRWAASMYEEVKQAKKVNVKQYYYLQEWLERFDIIVRTFTCYPEHHNMYKRGFEKLNQLCLTL